MGLISSEQADSNQVAYCRTQRFDLVASHPGSHAQRIQMSEKHGYTHNPLLIEKPCSCSTHVWRVYLPQRDREHMVHDEGARLSFTSAMFTVASFQIGVCEESMPKLGLRL
jgi:hypothetical protein